MTTSPQPRIDRGFSLIELLIVIVILGLLATVVVFSVRGITDDGQDGACAQDERIVATAIESYFANHVATALPAVGAADGEEYERGLVAAGMMRGLSEYFDVLGDGSMVAQAPCP